MNTTTTHAGNPTPRTLAPHFSSNWIARLLVVLVFMALHSAVQAQFNYTTENDQITITGYTGPGGAVDIPSTINGLPVIAVGDFAFEFETSLTSVTIPDSVTAIGAVAFIGCTSLANVTIGNSVSSIGDGAFGFCTSLTAIKVDPLNAFYSSVDGVLFDQNQTTLIQCPGGKSGSYTIPSSVTSLRSGAFGFCTSLTSVTIPDSFTSGIEVGTFLNCTSLTSVTIGNSVTIIGDYTFLDCISLTSITIPDSVTTIGSGAFQGCTSLSAITVEALNASYSSVDGVLFDKRRTTLILCPRGKSGSYTIPNGVSNIGYDAFASCSNLISVTIPNSVRSIGEFAFADCISLTNVTIGNEVTGIGRYAFSGCTNLTGVYFQGNTPSDDNGTMFDGAAQVTVYYLPGTTGWGATFAGAPTALWSLLYAVILSSGPGFGTAANGFGFLISWATNAAVVVEASPSLAAPVWTPVSTNSLNAGTSQFTDPQWTNYPTRFYRLVTP